MSTNDDLLANLITQNTMIAGKQDNLLSGWTALLAGTLNDPDSFSEVGGKTGDLGYYPITDVSGDTVYMPCFARQQALASAASAAGVVNSLSGYGYTATGVPHYAVAIALGGDLTALEGGNIATNPTDPNFAASQRWLRNAPISPGDIVTTWIRASLSYSDAQMTALFTAARSYI